MDLKDQLQQTIGGAFTLERELGGGGMSRVFIAEEKAYGRRVVIKVLPAELAQGVSVERFKREIQLAAQLQHPHIVPVHTSGEMNGLPYYTMPFVEGTSLRSRLATGPLPIGETISIVREVARALAYAHERGIVHRDIKPDNILLTGGSAVVTDFGIARAIAASRNDATMSSTGGGALTALGTAIGTPMYMAPEQAAGDPTSDHRADIYALGCTAYEMLAGRPPFTNPSPQKLLAAHMAEVPRPVAELRPDTPPALAALVMQCLAKDAEDRPKLAAEIARALDGVTSGSAHAAAPAIFSSVTLAKALGFYAIAFALIAITAKWAVTSIGVPSWVFPGAVLIMALGLPAILVTAYIQSTARRAFTATPTFTPGGTSATTRGAMATLALKASPHVSWSRTRRWGFYAVGAFALFVVLAMASRVSGIGPFATLLSAGEVKRGEPVVVADFTVPPGSDSSLGRLISDAVRADLEQSRAITVLPYNEIRLVLSEMQKGPSERMALPIAREIAQRRNLKAVVDGSLTPLGAGFVVNMRLVTADSLRELLTLTAAADSPSQLIEVVGELTRKLRGRFGESLKSVAESPRLPEATTSSLEALRKYSDGRRALAERSDMATYLRMTQEAIAIDSNFALAYVRMATELANLNVRPAEMARYAARAFALRERLSARERAQISLTYYRFGPPEIRNPRLAMLFIDSLVLLSKGTANEAVSLGYAGVDQSTRGHLDSGLALYRRAFELDSNYSRALGNVLWSYRRMGDRRKADSVFREFERRFPDGLSGTQRVADLVGRGEISAAGTLARSGYERDGSDPYQRVVFSDALRGLSERRGLIAEANDWSKRSADARAEYGAEAARLLDAAATAERLLLAFGDTTAAMKGLDAALSTTPIESLELLDRPYFEVGTALADAGHVGRAKSFVAGIERQYPPDDLDNGFKAHALRARIAMAERRWSDAVRELPPDLPARCSVSCAEVPRAAAYDGAGNADSALIWYERQAKPVGLASLNLVMTYRRMGELYAAKNEIEKAIDWYQKFVDAWKDAEPRLQPQVADVRRRIVRLKEQERRSR